MIVEGVVVFKPALNIFVVQTAESEFKFRLAFKELPLEYIRLRGHSCFEVAGITEGTPVELEITDWAVTDVRFAVADVEDREETSVISYIFPEGRDAMAKRSCGCSVHFSMHEVRRCQPTLGIEEFQIGQAILHRTIIRNEALTAHDTHIISEPV
jgi:hypothetical protein